MTCRVSPSAGLRLLSVLFFSFFFGSLQAQEEELMPDPFDRQVESTGIKDSLLLSSRPGYGEYRHALALREGFDYPGALAALQQALARDSSTPCGGLNWPISASPWGTRSMRSILISMR